VCFIEKIMAPLSSSVMANAELQNLQSRALGQSASEPVGCLGQRVSVAGHPANQSMDRQILQISGCTSCRRPGHLISMCRARPDYQLSRVAQYPELVANSREVRGSFSIIN
jgi:hypothetical protein